MIGARPVSLTPEAEDATIPVVAVLLAKGANPDCARCAVRSGS